jgi:hypothetical protein
MQRKQSRVWPCEDQASLCTPLSSMVKLRIADVFCTPGFDFKSPLTLRLLAVSFINGRQHADGRLLGEAVRHIPDAVVEQYVG